MRKIFKRFASFFLIPITRFYLRKERKYTYNNIEMIVKPGVFHPGFFYSTKFILSFLTQQDLRDKSLLELGCGSGLISIVAAKAGAIVTALDLSEKALSNTRINAQKNQVNIEIIKSDLFTNVENIIFDWIIVNPPYYAQNPKTEEELAWNCGENFEYFKKLFSSLADHINASSKVIMVLTMGCDLETIFSTARNEGFLFKLIAEKNVLFDEKDFLYEIKKV